MLQNSAPPMDPAASRSVIEEEFGKPVEEVFATWEDEAGRRGIDRSGAPSDASLRRDRRREGPVPGRRRGGARRPEEHQRDDEAVGRDRSEPRSEGDRERGTGSRAGGTRLPARGGEPSALRARCSTVIPSSSFRRSTKTVDDARHRARVRGRGVVPHGFRVGPGGAGQARRDAVPLLLRIPQSFPYLLCRPAPGNYLLCGDGRGRVPRLRPGASDRSRHLGAPPGGRSGPDRRRSRTGAGLHSRGSASSTARRPRSMRSGIT